MANRQSRSLQVGPCSAMEEPLVYRVHRLLDFSFGRGVAGLTQVDGKPIRPGTGDGFGVYLAAPSYRVLEHRLGPIIEQLVRHARNACQGVLKVNVGGVKAKLCT